MDSEAFTADPLPGLPFRAQRTQDQSDPPAARIFRLLPNISSICHCLPRYKVTGVQRWTFSAGGPCHDDEPTVPGGYTEYGELGAIFVNPNRLVRTGVLAGIENQRGECGPLNQPCIHITTAVLERGRTVVKGESVPEAILARHCFFRVTLKASATNAPERPRLNSCLGIFQPRLLRRRAGLALYLLVEVGELDARLDQLLDARFVVWVIGVSHGATRPYSGMPYV